MLQGIILKGVIKKVMKAIENADDKTFAIPTLAFTLALNDCFFFNIGFFSRIDR